MAQNISAAVTIWPTTTITTLGYTIPEFVLPSTFTSYTLASPLVCPQG